MESFAIAILLVLTGILFWQWWSTYLRPKKLPPGPTPLPIIGNLHLLGNNPHLAIHKLSQKYGPIMSMRLGSVPFVIVSSPEAAKLFVGTHDTVFASRPHTEATYYFSYGNKGIALTAYGPYWRSARKFCVVELLSVTKLNSFAGMRKEKIHVMVEELKVASLTSTRKVMDLREVICTLIEGMTCRMVFGKKNEDLPVFKKIFDEAIELVGAFNLADYVPLLAPFDLQGFTKRFKSLKKDIDGMFDTLINEHEESGLIGCQNPEEMDFIDILLSLKRQYSNTRDELSFAIDNSSIKAVLLELVAGTLEPTKASIEWILAALIKHPRVMKELQKELKSVIGDKPMVDEIDLPKLPYLRMVIKETFRLYPISPLLLPHESVEDITINGYNIPKKTRVFINYWAFGRDPKVWSDNWEEFLPERFLDKDIDFRGSDCQLIQFGTGRRGCPGMNLGLLFTGLVISNLVHCFEWELPDGMLPSDLDMKEKFGLTLPRIKPLFAIPINCT